jgi:outer membrane protein OmpA-like peptidoglycan-associated protein
MTKLIINFFFLNIIFSATSSLCSQSLEEDSATPEAGFTRGTRLIFQDNFEKDALGDFPALWTTTLSGEVKKLKGFDSKYLKIPADAVVSPQLKSKLGENFTIEMDLIMPSDELHRHFGFALGTKIEKVSYLVSNRNAVTFAILCDERSKVGSYKYYIGLPNKPGAKQTVIYKAPTDTKIHLAIMVNGTRIRCYIDGKKMADLPGAMKPEFRNYFYANTITSGLKESKTSYNYISNIVIAETGDDARSKVLKQLQETGSFTTNAILFAIGSNRLLPQSNEVIAQIKEALDADPNMKLLITGHTDSDGDDKVNLALSQKRAAAVKDALIKSGIGQTRLQTDGKGETEPAADNNSADGKAQNRRVVFTKVN